jgi:tetratricopeptide (TPR) repeat protein
MEAIIIEIVEKVVFSLTAKTITDGISKVFKKTREEKIINALQKALNMVARDNEFWKNDVMDQCEDVLRILVKQIGSTETSKIKLPSYLDQKTMDCFCDCLKEDDETWDYLQKLVNGYILRDLRDIDLDTNERVRNIENKLDSNNANSSTNDHFLTSTPSAADASNVIGREDDLEKLWKKLSEKKHVMLTGLGGIGKTKLAQMLFHNYRDRFEEVAWIKYKDDLRHSFSYHIEKYQNMNDPWEAMMNDLHNDGKKKLFIIDNVDDDTNQCPENDKDLRNLTGWKDTTILLTSRLEKLEHFVRYELKPLGKESCVSVFNHYYDGSEPDLEMVGKIVELANYHTLTIELLAKGAKRENLESYYEKIKSGFENVSRKITTDYNDRNVTIEAHLKMLFDMQQRSDTDKKVLNAFAVLPVNCECSLEEIEQWFGFGNEDLDEVIQDGWLSFDESKQTFSMHPLIRTIIRFDFLEDGQGKRTIAPDGTTDKILEYFVKHRDLGLFDINMGFVSLQRMIGIAESVIGAVDEKESVRFARLYHRIGWSYDDLSDYNKALEYYGKDLAISESKLGKDHPETATTYNSIALVYDNMGDYDKALEYYEKALEISESKLGKDHPDTATTYNNIGEVYRAKGDYDKALEYYEKTKDIFESKLGKDHPDTATTYNNIAAVYHDMGDYDKALEYYGKALEIRESKSGKDHPDTAATYNNMAGVYRAKGDYDKALEYYEKALEIVKSKLGKDHPYVASTYNNIALVYEAKGDYDKALEYYLKALRILLIKNKNHPNAKITIENLAICYQEANMEKDFDEWMKERLNEEEWAAYLELKGL